jgi:protein TIF31
MNRLTPGEGLVRERVLSRTIWGFTEEVVRGVEKVIRGEVETLIPFQEQPKDGEKEVKETQKLSDHTFVHNGILLIKAGTDGGTQFSKIGGEAAARVAAAKDLEGVKWLQELDTGGVGKDAEGEEGLGLQTCTTVIVDWLGQRWVCLLMTFS